MGRLIDADALWEIIRTWQARLKPEHVITDRVKSDALNTVIAIIENQTTIEAEPVRHEGTTTYIDVDDIDKVQTRIVLTENKKSKFCRVFYEDDREHGRWLPFTIGTGIMVGCTAYKCSKCGRIEEDNGEPYCHCGAKMDGKDIDVPGKICPATKLPCCDCVPGTPCAKMDGGSK